MHRIALAIAKGPDAGGAASRDPSGETAPRSNVFDDAFFPAWDESILDNAGAPGMGPNWWRMAREILRRDAQYDGIVTWGEKLTFALLALQQITSMSKPHIALMYQFEKPNVRMPLALLKQNLHAVVTWSSVQRRVLIDSFHYPSERVYL